ncbi:hypothetical protein AB2M62_08835 [Sphingomonas sp. MMS12-HWE2-04]|uniref:hypothetical protein n=1 Tax=Sphingomonas sp. MMS12-HWE2-04 TaxID=3234199 RepID=UPI00384E0310
MISRTLIAAMLLASPAIAQDKQKADGPPKRIRSVLLYNDEQCPKSADPEEIVVCANAGDSPYRIPKQFRNQPDESAGAQAWTNRVETVEQVNRAGLPNSCSPVGSGGQTGCTRQMLQQWAQDRVNRKAKEAQIP